jgi:RimJ/RimL family protein N-acetyltransferase
MSHPQRVTLRDGRVAELRPLHADDKARLQDAMGRLSPESRYRRFLGPHGELSERELAYLTEIDHHDHEAIAAADPVTGEILGVARFVRLEEDSDRAEAAVAVVDDWQGAGLGRALLERLSARAREEGLARFVALIQAENERAVALLSALGPTTRSQEGGVTTLDIELGRDGLGAALAQALRAAAGGVVGTAPLAERIRRASQLLWARRHGEAVEDGEAEDPTRPAA